MPASSRPAQRHGARDRLRVIAGSALLLATVVPAAGPLPVVASHTPAPSNVTIAGDLQSEIGCPGDWDPGLLADATSPTTPPTTSGRARATSRPGT